MPGALMCMEITEWTYKLITWWYTIPGTAELTKGYDGKYLQRRYKNSLSDMPKQHNGKSTKQSTPKRPEYSSPKGWATQ